MAMLFERSLQRSFDYLFERLRYEGMARHCRVETDFHDYALRICIDLNHGERRHFSFSLHELEMGREEGVRHFTEVLYRDCQTMCQRAGWPNQGHYEGREVRWMGIDRGARESETVRLGIGYGFATIRPEYFGSWGAEVDGKAEKKSRDLFIIGAGKKAYDTINAGKGLPITGSKGTKYTLHKRAAYCIERPKDGAKLCAVVPGVPLFDHLLGIKIMVENDEPKFLSIANVSPGESRRPAFNFW